MKKLAALLALSVAISSLPGCASTGQNEGTGQAVGILLGALAGAALGNNSNTRWVGALAGATAGAMIGSSIGRHLDEHDRLKAQAATNAAVRHPSSAVVQWTSDRNQGVAGVVHTSAATSTNQGMCKTVSHIVNVNGREQREDSRVCQRSDGSWASV